MTITFDRKTFYNAVRGPLFGGSLTQQQVDGLGFKLTEWERKYSDRDLRWLAYGLATSKHETASTMWPVEEYGKGAGASYGKPDPVTGLAYYGRGDVQLTWADNYKFATAQLGLTGAHDLYWHPDQALDPQVSADVMFQGMADGWFRKPNKLSDYFNASREDPYNARDIINGDKNTVPKWSNGVSIGNLIAGYYADFLAALEQAEIRTPAPEPVPETVTVEIALSVVIDRNGNATASVTRCAIK